jgi:F0F1-type ATP synthase assembly protein I
VDPKSPKEESRPDHRAASPLTEVARFSGHGLTVAVSTGLFLMVGWWVDGKLGTRPLFAIGGALIGAAAGLYSMVQHVLLIPRAEEERRRAESESSAEEP